MSWTIQTPSTGGPITFAAANISAPKRSLKNSSADSFTFSQISDVTGAPLCNYGDAVTIWNGDTMWFQGVCQLPKANASGPGEKFEIEISGGWYWLEVLILQQNWKNVLATTFNLGRVLFGYQVDTVDGEYVLVWATIGATIAGIIDWAVSCGCNIQMGEGSAIATLCPAIELLDVSCAEALRRILKYTPDVVSWTDYTTTPPTINFQSRYDLPTLTQEFGGPDFSLTCWPRPDLIPPQIVINYEITSTNDGTPGITISPDADPGGSTGNVPRALVMTIPINGANLTFAKQRLRVKPIPFGLFASDLSSEDLQTIGRFLKLFVPQFALCDPVDGDPQTPDLLFYPLDASDPDTFYSVDLAQPDGVNGDSEPFVYQDPTNTESAQVTLDTSLTNALLEGIITPWMPPATRGQVQIIQFRVSWKNNGILAGIDPQLQSPGILMTITVTATNGTNQVYHELQQYEPSEGLPVGMAAALALSLGVLQYEGAAKTVETEVSGAMVPGNVMNVVGGRDEWESMAALIQMVEEDIDAGKTTARFGPAAHLSVTDAISVMKMGRPPDWDSRNAGANAAPQFSGLL